MYEMISIEIVVALAMAITNTFKNRLSVATVPFVSIAIALILNLVNAALFGGDLLLAGQEAFITSGIIVGLFNAGTATRKLAHGSSILEREEK